MFPDGNARRWEFANVASAEKRAGMKREVCSQFRKWSVMILPLGLMISPASAQVIHNQTNYNSLTAIAGTNASTTDVTANIIANTGHDLDPNKNATGKAAYAFRFGVDATTEGATDVPGSVADLSGVGGGNTLSTVIVADDLQLQVNTTSQGSGPFGKFRMTGLRFLVSNANASSLTVTAHLRVFDDNATIGSNGGFAGTLLQSYDIGGVTLNGNGGGYASATQVSVPSSSFTTSPLNLDFSQFQKQSSGHYRTRLWVGLFFTADSTTVTATQLANVGGVIYDPNESTYTPTTDYSVDPGGIGTSDDQFYGDDINRPSVVGPTENFNTTTHKPYDKNFNQFQDTSIYTTGSLDNGGNGPEANMTWFIDGDIVVPEPGTFALLAVGGFPNVGLIRLRKP
jgi:hypothetical protein